MTQPAIRVENIAKQYQIGAQEKGYSTFREAIMGLATAPFQRFRRLAGRSQQHETFWALKDISFDVQPGEVVGIIGRNGAGKSTLLKILTQITEPTEGRATIRGRVGSLLEVGTGFHAELTGRENVFLNGAILGMSRVEIKSKFDEIVAFSGVEKFLDTPVKRYSSGMKVRLAFAVAAHLEPEILLIDEVLAVGDVEFQKKCLGKMQDAATGGRTVLFVSHNMGAILDLCTRVLLLTDGHITGDGDAARIVTDYERSVGSQEPGCAGALKGATLALNSDEFELRDVILNSTRDPAAIVHPPMRGLTFDFQCSTAVSLDELLFSFALINDRGHQCIWERFEGEELKVDIASGAFTLCVEIPPIPLGGGIYSVNFMVRSSGSLEKVCHFKNIAHFSAGTRDGVEGILSPPIHWHCRGTSGDLHDS